MSQHNPRFFDCISSTSMYFEVADSSINQLNNSSYVNGISQLGDNKVKCEDSKDQQMFTNTQEMNISE